MKALTASEAASFANARLIGNGDALIQGVAEIEEAGMRDLAYAVSAKYVEKLKNSAAEVVLVPPGDWEFEGKTLLVAEKPYFALARILEAMDDRVLSQRGISPEAHIHPDASVASDAVVYPGVFVDAGAVIGSGVILHANVTVLSGSGIGEQSVLYPGAVVREGCQVGKRCVLQPNCVIGSDGFGFVEVAGSHFKIPQIGRVILEDDVEIGANTTVDRGTFRDTVIGMGSKLDNLVQIGHNVLTGKACLFAAQSGISGSTKLGDHVTFAGQSGSVGHIKIGSRTVVMARGVATKDLPGGQFISGFPGRDHSRDIREQAALKRVPELRKKLIRVMRFLGLETG